MARPDDPPPPVHEPTYLFTPRRLAVLGLLCAVLGAVILGNLGSRSTPSATPDTTSEAPPPPAPMSSPAPTPAAPSPTGPPAPTPAPPVGTVPPGRAGIPRGTPPTPGPVNLADPTAVGEAFTAATFSYDANIDVSPADAQRRSMQFATPSYAAKLQGSGTQPGGAQWSTLTDHLGYTTPTLTDHLGYTTPTLTENHDGGRPPDTPTTAVRSWAVTITGHGADNWTAPMGTALVFVSLTRTSPTTPWQVSGVQIPSAT